MVDKYRAHEQEMSFSFMRKNINFIHSYSSTFSLVACRSQFACWSKKNTRHTISACSYSLVFSVPCVKYTLMHTQTYIPIVYINTNRQIIHIRAHGQYNKPTLAYNIYLFRNDAGKTRKHTRDPNQIERYEGNLSCICKKYVYVYRAKRKKTQRLK